ncbi:hypothetical protein [Priestia megaterium]|nr:hypothetical protein [Priestia megaterium]
MQGKIGQPLASAKKEFGNDDNVTFKGVAGAGGDKDKNAQFNWKLYDGKS